MGEAETIHRSPAPRTRESLADDMRRLGVQAGMTLIVHSSLSALGWVCGGAVAVVQALQDVLTAEGTLVMPTQTAGLSDPAEWVNPPIPADWVAVVREQMPAYDPLVTPTRGMGAVVETFRTWPGTIRSDHPHHSFAAWGRHKERVIRGHQLEYGFGEHSPLARLYELDAYVLLLGVGYDSNTSFHLAEHRAPGAVRRERGAPVMENGVRLWKVFADIELDSDRFPAIGTDFEATGNVTVGPVGSAESRLFSQRAGVDFATEWLTKHGRA
jgi:aminoglycoside 3-N-acetyltransferase